MCAGAACVVCACGHSQDPLERGPQESRALRHLGSPGGAHRPRDSAKADLPRGPGAGPELGVRFGARQRPCARCDRILPTLHPPFKPPTSFPTARLRSACPAGSSGRSFQNRPPHPWTRQREPEGEAHTQPRMGSRWGGGAQHMGTGRPSPRVPTPTLLTPRLGQSAPGAHPDSLPPSPPPPLPSPTPLLS